MKYNSQIFESGNKKNLKILNSRTQIFSPEEIMEEYEKTISQRENLFGTSISVDAERAVKANNLPNLFAEIETNTLSKKYVLLGTELQDL